MSKADKTDSDQAQASSAAGEIGDVETAGETTAAAAIKGPTDTRPVGAETMVRVADTPHPAKDDQN